MRNFLQQMLVVCCLRNFAHAGMIYTEQYQRDLKGLKKKKWQDQSGHMLSSKRYENVMFNIILKQSVCLCVCVSACVLKVRKDTRGRKSVRHTCQTESTT